MHYIHKLQTAFSNMSLKKKMYFSCALLSSLIFLLFSFIGLNTATKASNDLLSKSIHASIASSAGSLSYTLSDILDITTMMIADKTIQDNLSTIHDSPGPEERIGAQSTLRTTLTSYHTLFREKHINYISLYTNQSYVHSDLSLGSSLPGEIRDRVVATAKDLSGNPYWCTDYVTEHSLLLARTIRDTRSGSFTDIGTVIISIDISKIAEEAVSYSNQYSECSYLIYDNSRLVYTSDSWNANDLSAIPANFSDGYEVFDINGHKYFAVAGNIPDFSWRYICLMSYDSTWQALRESYVSYTLIVLAALILAVLIVHITINQSLKHIDRLIDKMKRYHGSDTDLVLPDPAYKDRTDELGQLHRQFDQMALEINNLIKDNYENELLMKDAQLTALEMQINPHFLYNTLETVNWRAKAIGEPVISKMVESLGQLLRKTLSNKKEENTLRDELEIVQCYMTITKLRFEDRLDYQCIIPSELMDALLPKLTLQPLVENAVHYALEEITDLCHIRIEAELLEEQLRIRVFNNGSQFDEDLLEKLENQQIIPRGLGIGLLNINKRLQLFFGAENGIHFYNDDEYAVAEIQIPYRPAE